MSKLYKLNKTNFRLYLPNNNYYKLTINDNKKPSRLVPAEKSKPSSNKTYIDTVLDDINNLSRKISPESYSRYNELQEKTLYAVSLASKPERMINHLIDTSINNTTFDKIAKVYDSKKLTAPATILGSDSNELQDLMGSIIKKTGTANLLASKMTQISHSASIFASESNKLQDLMDSIIKKTGTAKLFASKMTQTSRSASILASESNKLQDLMDSIIKKTGTANLLASINYDAWIKSFVELIDETSEESKEYRLQQLTYLDAAKEKQWFLDEDLLEYCLETLDNKEQLVFDEAAVANYVSDNFKSYVEDINNMPWYKTQIKIINQSVTAFHNDDYGLGIFPLFAAFDNIISRWARNILFKPYNYEKVYIGRLAQKFEKSIIERETLNNNIKSFKLLKGMNLMHAFMDLFENNPKDKTKLNRNAILHGSYNYELVTKNEYLKMIVLLKSASSLLEISFEDIIQRDI